MTRTACEGCRLEGLGTRSQPWGGLYGILGNAQSSSGVCLLSLLCSLNLARGSERSAYSPDVCPARGAALPYEQQFIAFIL